MRTDLLLRALLPVAALVALAADTPRPVYGGLALAGLAVTTERLTRLRRSSIADRLLVGLGGLVVTLVLTGLALDLVGVRLTPTSWTLAVALLALVGLGIGAVLPARPVAPDPDDRPATAGTGRRTAVLALPWAALAVLVVVVSVHMTTSSLLVADEAPVQMSFGTVSGTQVQVVVSTTDPIGPLEVRTSADGDEISYPLFSLGADGSRTTTVSLPKTGRYVITVNYPRQTEPLRTLVLAR